MERSQIWQGKQKGEKGKRLGIVSREATAMVRVCSASVRMKRNARDSGRTDQQDSVARRMCRGFLVDQRF